MPQSNKFIVYFSILSEIPYCKAWLAPVPKTGTLANSEDPDETQHNAAFHMGLHFLLRLKQPSETDIHNKLETSTCNPFKYKMDNRICIVLICMGKSIRIQRVHVDSFVIEKSGFQIWWVTRLHFRICLPLFVGLIGWMCLNIQYIEVINTW